MEGVGLAAGGVVVVVGEEEEELADAAGDGEKLVGFEAVG